MASSCTNKLAEFVVETGYNDLPPQAVETAKRAIMDTLGVAVAGSHETISGIISQLISEEHGTEEATLIASKIRSSVQNCAFGNGVIFHALDYDDSYYDFTGPTRIHPSSPILAACFAICEKLGANGTDILEAFILGVEVTGAVNRGLGPSHYGRGWHATSTVGVFGAAAAVSKLMNLKADELQTAFGIAASLASGVRQNLGTMVKPIHVGHAARNGFLSAILASKGTTADKNILDMPMGFALFCDEGEWDAKKTVQSLGDPWAIINPGLRIKRYPSCGGTHRPLDALFQIFKENNISSNDIEKVYVITSEAPKALIHPRPKTGLQGKFSMEYCISCAIIDGYVGLESFTDSAVLRKECQAFLEKVEVVEKKSQSDRSVAVEIECVNGAKFSSKVLHPSGTPQYPLTWSELENKYRQCVSPILPNAYIDESINMIKSFENLPDTSSLINLFSRVS